MPLDWNEYFVLARQLATARDEASKRSAISRAYYFVFNIAFFRAEATAGGYPVAKVITNGVGISTDVRRMQPVKNWESMGSE
jgi:hypothetical protein